MRGSHHQLDCATGVSLAAGERLEGRQPHATACDSVF